MLKYVILINTRSSNYRPAGEPPMDFLPLQWEGQEEASPSLFLSTCPQSTINAASETISCCHRLHPHTLPRGQEETLWCMIPATNSTRILSLTGEKEEESAIWSSSDVHHQLQHPLPFSHLWSSHFFLHLFFSCFVPKKRFANFG